VERRWITAGLLEGCSGQEKEVGVALKHKVCFFKGGEVSLTDEINSCFY